MTHCEFCDVPILGGRWCSRLCRLLDRRENFVSVRPAGQREPPWEFHAATSEFPAFTSAMRQALLAVRAMSHRVRPHVPLLAVLLAVSARADNMSEKQKDFLLALQTLMAYHGVERIAHPGPQGGKSWPGHTFVIEFDGGGADNLELSYLAADRMFHAASGSGTLPLNDRQRAFVVAVQGLLTSKQAISIQAQACTREAQGHKFAIDFREPQLTPDQINEALLITYEDFELQEITQ